MVTGFRRRARTSPSSDPSAAPTQPHHPRLRRRMALVDGSDVALTTRYPATRHRFRRDAIAHPLPSRRPRHRLEVPGSPARATPSAAPKTSRTSPAPREFRDALIVGPAVRPQLLLTIAMGCVRLSSATPKCTRSRAYVDTVNLMSTTTTSPAADPSPATTRPSTPTPRIPQAACLADAPVRAFQKAGVPPPNSSSASPSTAMHGLTFPPPTTASTSPASPRPTPERPSASLRPTCSVTASRARGIRSRRFRRSTILRTRTFVSYEDEQSIAGKCKYVHAHKIAGIMVWDLEDDDRSGKLMKAINACLLQ